MEVCRVNSSASTRLKVACLGGVQENQRHLIVYLTSTKFYADRLVDTTGLLLAAVIHAANIQYRDGARLVLAKLLGRFHRLKVIWADAAYAGRQLGLGPLADGS